MSLSFYLLLLLVSSVSAMYVYVSKIVQVMLSEKSWQLHKKAWNVEKLNVGFVHECFIFDIESHRFHW